ncbi:hypothetical protein AAG570_004741 [Ranatra chinensis]|uniref:Uncharacterized protein n=1 Tax=Ranatra chinensis TaxID=642074 RepID=A0ABD0Y402_9HEMI
MASKRRNVFYENKKQETTEIGTCNLPAFCDIYSCTISNKKQETAEIVGQSLRGTLESGVSSMGRGIAPELCHPGAVRYPPPYPDDPTIAGPEDGDDSGHVNDASAFETVRNDRHAVGQQKSRQQMETNSGHR